ncbi:MAG: hypothetical protein GYA41_11485 [Bacteroidales bacterium]|nr:hypothetical protein [Bacteroidales bacterium]
MAETLSIDQAFLEKLSGIVLANINDENFGAEQLAERSGMNHASLYRKIKAITDRKFKEAENEFLRSIQLNPNSSSAHQAYAQLLMITGPIWKSREHVDRLMELEPYFRVAHNLNSWIYYFERKYKQGIDACITGCELNPYSLDNDWLFIIHYTRMGEGEKAAKELKDIFTRYLKTNQYEGEITDAYNKSGIRGLYEWLIDLNINRPVGMEGMNGHSFYFAWWYAILGRKE